MRAPLRGRRRRGAERAVAIAERAASPPARPREADASITLARLAAAIREHRSATSRAAVPKRPADHALYRRLQSLEQAAE